MYHLIKKSNFLIAACPPGYDLIPGGIDGNGLIVKYPSYENTILDCSDRCNGNSYCCSFEYSATDKKCSLNKNCQPNTTVVLKDYIFCRQGNLFCFLTKGQIISKCLFVVFNVFQKTNKNTPHSSKNEFICSFFGRIHDLTICF